jgi:hypothetical protein
MASTAEGFFLAGLLSATLFDRNMPLRVRSREMDPKTATVTLTLVSGRKLIVTVEEVQ